MPTPAKSSLPAATWHLFVYGTLRRQFAGPMPLLLRRHADFIDYAYLQGKLYNVGSYPGAIVSDDPADLVFGEVYQLRPQSWCWTPFDAYEACGGHDPEVNEYERCLVRVSTQSGCRIAAWAYCYRRPVTGLEFIGHGDYVRFLRRPS